MQVGEVVVLVEDVDGIKAGHEGRIMSLRDNMVMVGCRSRDRLHVMHSASLASSLHSSRRERLPGKSRGSKVNRSAHTTRRRGTDIGGLTFWR